MRAGTHRGEQRIVVVIHGQHADPHRRRDPGHSRIAAKPSVPGILRSISATSVGPAPPRGWPPCRRRRGRPPRSPRASDQHTRETRPHDGVVVGDQNADHAGTSGSNSPRTWLPLPPGPISWVPPSSATRSRMPASPTPAKPGRGCLRRRRSPRSAGGWCRRRGGSAPTDACECRTTLVMASVAIRNPRLLDRGREVRQVVGLDDRTSGAPSARCLDLVGAQAQRLDQAELVESGLSRGRRRCGAPPGSRCAYRPGSRVNRCWRSGRPVATFYAARRTGRHR